MHMCAFNLLLGIKLIRSVVLCVCVQIVEIGLLVCSDISNICKMMWLISGHGYDFTNRRYCWYSKHCS